MKQIISTTAVTLSLLAFSVSSAFAHVVVKPAQVGVAAYQTFTIGVPNEQDQPTTGVRLVIPDGLEHVSPNVKAGWKIEIKTAPTTEGGDDHGHATGPVTEITWTGGSIPVGQRDDFIFSAKAPAEMTTLTWKAYQTYQDGTVVSWDQDPNAEPASEATAESQLEQTGPYSKTEVVNDLAQAVANTPAPSKASTNTLSILAVTMSGAALAMQLFGKKK